MLTVNCTGNELNTKQKQKIENGIKESIGNNSNLHSMNNIMMHSYYKKQGNNIIHYNNSIERMNSMNNVGNMQYKNACYFNDENFDSNVRFLINDKNVTKMYNDGNTDINEWSDKSNYNILKNDKNIKSIIKKDDFYRSMDNKKVINESKNTGMNFNEIIMMSDVSYNQYNNGEERMYSTGSSCSALCQDDFEKENIYKRKKLNLEDKVQTVSSSENEKYDSLNNKCETGNKAIFQVIKGPWTKDEDSKLIELIKCFGPKNWSKIAELMQSRIGKQCRERWHNHLHPNIKKTPFTTEEDILVIQLHSKYGNRWSEIAKFLPGRTDNAVKNHWNSALQKKMKKRSFSVQSTICLRNERCCCGVCIRQKMQVRRSKSVIETKYGKNIQTKHEAMCKCRECLENKRFTTGVILHEKEDVKRKYESLSEEEKIATIALLKLQKML